MLGDVVQELLDVADPGIGDVALDDLGHPGIGNTGLLGDLGPGAAVLFQVGDDFLQDVYSIHPIMISPS